MRIVNIRRSGQDDQGSPGRLTTPGFRCFSLELPWRDNKPEVSCLPEGVYWVRWSLSPRLKKWTYEIIEQIAERGGFRMHSGNFAGDRDKGMRTDSLGCPLLGYQMGIMHGQRATLISRPAVNDFVTFMERKPFALEIQ